MRPVRRNFYDPSSAPGKGIVWEWENDGGAWTAYDMDICITIQNAYEKQHPWLDLSSLGFCYLIYFNSMSQMNRQTRRRRRLRRRLDLAYPLTVGSIPKSQSWPVGASSGQPCSCQQCLLVNSTRAASNAILASQRRKAPPAPPPPQPPPGGPSGTLADFTEEGNPDHTSFGNAWVMTPMPQDMDPVSLSASHPGIQIHLISAEDQTLKSWNGRAEQRP
ncbi:hypothetical protein MJG53_014457 [Ovis ammon polii x Ovis aries]|uniref:Uncharacterized protein n=1 Tax=Ovis ammon polii x Ovis aries TaxID=2918886 RepID=A0ACB9UGW2_9CETA|nr:hypothetical protein MJG53_014457 [Ovis ammon polii x Ovis aries]